MPVPYVAMTENAASRELARVHSAESIEQWRHAVRTRARGQVGD